MPETNICLIVVRDKANILHLSFPPLSLDWPTQRTCHMQHGCARSNTRRQLCGMAAWDPCVEKMEERMYFRRHDNPLLKY